MAIRHPLSPLLSAASQSIQMSAALSADGKHTPPKNRYWKAHPRKIGAKRKKKNRQ